MLSAWPAQRDELREIFNDISSSSEDEEDEGDRHEDEDLNIMDTEDDLVRQLQEKLNESDSAQNESDRNSQIGEIYHQGFCADMTSFDEHWWYEQN